MKIEEVTSYLESIAPLDYQESYDNAGLIAGDSQGEVSNILISLDCTEAVVNEAVKKKCNLIISHHPPIFPTIKKISTTHAIGRTLISAIRNGISIYAIHTNLDNVFEGVNHQLATLLGLSNLKILAPMNNKLSKLVTFIPGKNSLQVMKALWTAGAGNIGNYSQCSFQTDGTGTFIPNADANPHIGKSGKISTVKEKRVEVIFPSVNTNKILDALHKSHPYEEVAYYLSDLSNPFQSAGAGMIGNLSESLAIPEFLERVKSKLEVKCIRYSGKTEGTVKRIAVCGGAGSFLLPHAIKSKADVFITADIKYHTFFETENKLLLLDVGHWESEVGTKNLILRLIQKKFHNLAAFLADSDSNPVNYYC
ncbi:MAG: Nif3-like dinuclear metal center hexameric protein [Bacteroidetes bacterium RIFCSPLOWO2_02_FULL_36_8]|nr:MAG: Nif3-like dinuclear metal center hexameric protein [Bacteroidetes bacterium RIFCSPLOWO2_02_FULL_36_8]OFY69276.1 MAG: Nif3-like dinuclear metal center hexameric protein [Bacteroidetes bacterium RIFCSPLOWO2_12_FULL_37_12]